MLVEDHTVEYTWQTPVVPRVIKTILKRKYSILDYQVREIGNMYHLNMSSVLSVQIIFTKSTFLSTVHANFYCISIFQIA